MMKRIALFAALATTLVASAAMAAGPAKGKFGLGYFDPNAPVGVRYWVNEKVGVDLGVGFSQTEDQAETLNGYRIDIGVPISVANYENAFFFVRPGFIYDTQQDLLVDFGPPVVVDKYDINSWAIGLDLGVEWFINDRFSLQVGHGFGYSSTKADLPGAETSTGIQTRDLGISNVGFHFYFN